MSLFTDGTGAGISDLVKYDSSLLDVSLTEAVNLTGKLKLALEEVGVELHGILKRSWTETAFSLTCARMDVRNVVVNEPLRLWHVYQTLTMVYRDVYFNQLNDRYQAKWKEYASLASWAKNKVVERGLGVVTNPVVRGYAPLVTFAAAAESGGTFYFSVSYVNAQGEEGEAGSAIAATTPDGDVADLQVSNGPANATGWNCYAGMSPELLYLQNSSPLDIETDFVYYPSAAVATGPVPGGGQRPNFYRALPRLLQRG